MKLALDHHYPSSIAPALRDHGHDAVAAIERGWQAEEDEDLLEFCASEGRSLLTNNVADFAIIARRWRSEGRSHLGLIFTSFSTLPRTHHASGRYIDALNGLLLANPGDHDLVDQIRWL